LTNWTPYSSAGVVSFPFVAVPGQQKIKNSLIWNLINPRIGGLLIAGEKGTAKSTMVRALEPLAGRRVVELPLNCTEDRLVGAMDFRAALGQGRRILEGGLLMRADGNILYIDEVNLLADHLVNALLAASVGSFTGNTVAGENIVEREGISARHESCFILIGAMNREEGNLRPQFLDRFGLCVEAAGEKEPLIRAEIVKRRLEFEKNPLGFAQRYARETEDLAARIASARAFLPRVVAAESGLFLAASLAAEQDCAGHRGELTLVEAARAIAAFAGRSSLIREDLLLAAEYALPHRARKAAPSPVPPETVEAAGKTGRDAAGPEHPNITEKNDASQSLELPGGPGGAEAPAGKGEKPRPLEGPEGQRFGGRSGMAGEDIQAPGKLFIIPQWQDPRTRASPRRGSGKRGRVQSRGRQGRYVGYRLPFDREAFPDIALDATLRAAAPFQKSRRPAGSAIGAAIVIEAADLRVKIRENRIGASVLFVVDASASMGANKRMREVKAAIISLLRVSYQKRDKVALIIFRRDRAELLLGFTRSVELAQKKLEAIPTGGFTPIAQGLEMAYEMIMGLKMRESGAPVTMALVTDGKASGVGVADPFGDALRAAERIGSQGINTIIIDTENNFIPLRRCERLNEKLKGNLITMEDLEAEGILAAVSKHGAYK
jgi:magnesium chelatase subunit D